MSGALDLSLAEAGRRLRDGSLSAVALAEQALARIAAVDPGLHAFITVTAERAMADARRADAELAAGRDRGPLHGLPYALKDIYDTAGIRTTCHSRLFVDRVPAADARAAQKLAEAGGVLLGKLATHEFAIGGPSFDLPFPPARNPWNPDHITGGSSSGSGAALAAGMVRLAMGSDTGGSIRGPAAYCGMVGLKPTYGRVSRRGVYPLSYTLDHCGPLTRSVEDTAIAMQILAGHDPEDPASVDWPVPDYRAGLQAGVAGLRLGLPRHLYADAPLLGAETAAGIDRVVEGLRRAGAIVEEITLPDYALFGACGRVIMMAEAFAVHEADLRARPQDYGAIAYQRIALGAAITAADLVQALRLRRELVARVQQALAGHDALITAAALDTAPRFADFTDPLSLAASALQTIPFNVTGHPAMSLPIGLAGNGLPLSMQIVGRAFDEAMVLRIGRAVEQISGWESVALPTIAEASA